jgi:hypothetical protein
MPRPLASTPLSAAALLVVAACGGAGTPAAIGSRGGGGVARGPVMVFVGITDHSMFEAACHDCEGLRADLEGQRVSAGAASFRVTGAVSDDCDASGATEVVGVERLTGDEEHDPLLVAVLPAGAPIDVQVHPREPRPAGDPALRAALVRVAAADVGDRGGPIVAADLVIDQVIDVNVVGDARPDRLIAVNAPLPEGDGPGYRWSALVLAPSGDLAAARSVWTSDLESIFLDASFDLDGDGVRELIYSSDYYEGGGRGGATIEDGALHPLGTWACGA